MLKAAFAIAFKDLRLLSRDRAGFFFTFIFPLLYGVFFGLIMRGGGGGPSGLPIVVFDADATETSSAFVERLGDSSAVRIVGPVESEAAGRDMVRKGDARALVVTPEGFGAAMDTPLMGGPIRLSGAIDPSSPMAGGIMQGVLTEALFTVLGERVTDPAVARSMVGSASESLAQSDASPAMKLMLGGVFNSLDNLLQSPEVETDAEAGAEPDTGGGLGGLFDIDLEELRREGRKGPANMYEITIPQANAWALMGCIFGFATSLVLERSKGTMPRVLSAPVSRSTVLVGKGLGCFMTAIAVQWFLLLIGVLFLGVHLVSLPVALLATFSSAFAFVGVMMLLAILGKTEQGTEGMGRAVLLLLAFVGGAAVPIDFLGIGWLQSVASFSPFRWSILAMEGAIWRSYSMQEMLLPCGILIALGLVGSVLGAKMFDFSRAEGDR